MKAYALLKLKWYSYLSIESSVVSVCVSLENIWKTIEKEVNKFMNIHGDLSEIIDISIRTTGVIILYERPCMNAETIEWRIQTCNINIEDFEQGQINVSIH